MREHHGGFRIFHHSSDSSSTTVAVFGSGTGRTIITFIIDYVNSILIFFPFSCFWANVLEDASHLHQHPHLLPLLLFWAGVLGDA